MVREISLTSKQATAAATSSMDPALVAEGYDLILKEKEMSFIQALKHHWRALLWSMFFSMALVMDGYDGSIVSLPLDQY
jgi:SP family general alpha glucoside:H+ symporter-like MFS transporter